jgi:hypothetical protein
MVLLASLLTACNLPARSTATPIIDQALAGTIVAMTLESLHAQSASNTPTIENSSPQNPGIENSPFPSSTPSQVMTATQTGTITPTYSAPMLRFDGNTNCREGPGTEYKVVTVLHSGQQVEPAGVQGNYWIVKNPNGKGTCWVAADFATPSGSTWTLTTMTAPPPPTSEPPTAPTWSKWHYNCVFAPGGFTLTMNLVWTDLANNETGYRVYRDGQVVATLGAGSNSYTDVAFDQSGKTLSYYVEVYKDSVHASSSTINAVCQ